MKNIVKSIAIVLTALTLSCSDEDKQQESPFSPEADGFTLELGIVKNGQIEEEEIGALQMDMYASVEDWKNSTNKIYSSPVVLGKQELFLDFIKTGEKYYMDIYTADGKYDNWGRASIEFSGGRFFTEAPRGNANIGINLSNRRFIGTHKFERFDSVEGDTLINVTPALIPVSMTINSNNSVTFIDKNAATGATVSNTADFLSQLDYFTPLVSEEVEVSIRVDDILGEFSVRRGGVTRVYYTIATAP